MWLLEFGHIDKAVFYIFCAVAAVVCILALANMLAGFCLPHYRCVRLGHTTGANAWVTLQVRTPGPYYRCVRLGNTTGAYAWATLQVRTPGVSCDIS